MIDLAQNSPGVRRRIVALLGSPRATRQLHQVSDVGLWHSLGASEPRVNRLIVPAGSGVVTVELIGRLRESWQSRAHTGSGDGGAHGEAPGELAITGSHGEKSSKSGLQG